MSKFDLRDISERLANSSDTEAVIHEFLGYLQSMQADWRASLVFYEISQDALVKLYRRDGHRLVKRDISMPVDQLPARLVRKFFHPSAIFNQSTPRALLFQFLRTSPTYEFDPTEATQLRPIAPVADWESCICMPLADREDILALVVIASEKRKAFSGRAAEEIIPVKSMAAMALVQHLHRTHVRPAQANEEQTSRVAASEFQERIRKLNEHALTLEEDNRAKDEKLAALRAELEQIDQNASESRQELERVKGTVLALEEQSGIATQHLTEAFTELNQARQRLGGLERTFGLLKDVFQLLAREHDPTEVSRTVVAGLCEHFGVERCSLMLLDASEETLTIAAQCGIDPVVAGRVRVRVGQGVAGWVAQHRKPLFVRVPDDVPDMPRSQRPAYNSDSFICTPLIFDDQLVGVLSLSNTRTGEPFEEIDLDRASLVGSLLAVTLAGQDSDGRAAVG